MRDWFTTLGISRPTDTSDWIPGATIFEAQIGTSVFWKGFEYSPYPTMRDLYRDLGRIAGLGFDCIQIMPRQPFPATTSTTTAISRPRTAMRTTCGW